MDKHIWYINYTENKMFCMKCDTPIGECKEQIKRTNNIPKLLKELREKEKELNDRMFAELKQRRKE